MIDITNFMKLYAEAAGGQYTAFSDKQCNVIVPVSGGRFQTVTGNIRNNELYNRKLITLTSKVCSLHADLAYRMLLEQTAFFNYCRFVIRENYLQIEAVCSVDYVSEEEVSEMIMEVANLADQYEMKLTGKDRN